MYKRANPGTIPMEIRQGRRLRLAKTETRVQISERMRLFQQRIWCGAGLVIFGILFATSLVSAQMLGTFNGRVADQQGDALTEAVDDGHCGLPTADLVPSYLHVHSALPARVLVIETARSC